MQNVKNKKLLILLPTFLLGELCLLLVILFADLDVVKYSYFCFFSIVLALVFALGFLKKDLCIGLLLEGLLFSVCADIFLVLPLKYAYKNYVLGLSFCSVVQVIYFLYFFFKTESKEARITHGFVRSIVILATELLGIIILKEKMDAVAGLGIFYMANLLVSVVLAYMQGKKSLVFAVALTLFLCSGVFAGLSTAVGSYFQVAENSFLYKLANADFNFVWLFYLPAQTLVATYAALQSANFKY